jgi:DUF4097 and DUF4098 domain-containing protein YvlB
VSRPLFLLASVAVAAAIVFSAISILDAGARASERRVVTYDAARSLRVESAAGDVRVVGADVERVEVRMRITRGLSAPAVTTALRGGTLVLEDDCPAVVLGSCRVDYELRVPRDVAVAVDSGAGDVEAADLTAGVELESSAGEVRASRIGGRLVRLSSSAGDVSAEELTAASVDATSSAGDVDLDVAKVPERVLAESSAGNVRVLLPDAAYAVDAETSAGDEDVTVRQDPGARAGVRLRSSAGDVVVAPR